MIKGCQKISLPQHKDSRGSLVVCEAQRESKFGIKRIYYIYGAQKKTVRGAHAHKSLEQLIIAVSGSVEFVVDNGSEKQSLVLNDPTVGLYLAPMIWREIKNFSEDAVILVLASDYYDEKDYIREVAEFRRLCQSNSLNQDAA